MNGGMSAIGPKRTCVAALHEFAFGGKADMALGQMSAFDPKRTSVVLTSDPIRSNSFDTTMLVLRELNEMARAAAPSEEDGAGTNTFE
jgi:hypothetical protein